MTWSRYCTCTQQTWSKHIHVYLMKLFFFTELPHKCMYSTCICKCRLDVWSFVFSRTIDRTTALGVHVWVAGIPLDCSLSYPSHRWTRKAVKSPPNPHPVGRAGEPRDASLRMTGRPSTLQWVDNKWFLYSGTPLMQTPLGPPLHVCNMQVPQSLPPLQVFRVKPTALLVGEWVLF